MKLLLEPIQVQVNDKRQPVRLMWRLRPYRVKAVQEMWLYRGQWWVTPQLRGHRRLYYRVECVTLNGMTICFEIFHQWGRWTLSRVLD
jgi:hypothetical protein